MTAKTFDDLKRDIIDTGLCTRCGTCVAVCREQVISFDDPLGACLPKRNGSCESCDGICYEVCPGQQVSWPELNHYVFGDNPPSYLLGNYQRAYVGFATERLVRENAASGGVITAISLYLLESGQVDGVVTLKNDDVQPYRSVPQIATDRAAILGAAQSRYSISPLNTILNQLTDKTGEYAYVGLPTEIHSLRKLQQIGHPIGRRIRYVIGSYCGNILHFTAIQSFLARNGVHDLSQVASLKYRAGEWPGRLEIRLMDGRVLAIKKFYANYLIPFHIMQRCLLCTDLSSEFADISVGDGWSPAYEDHRKGWSIVIARTADGVRLLSEMTTNGLLELHPITEGAAVDMHSHGLDFKKRGGFLRIRARDQRNLPVPDYGYVLGHVPMRRRLQELILGLIFRLGAREISRRAINLVPLWLIGRVFEFARRVWISGTKSTKRGGLMNTEFRITKDVKSDDCGNTSEP